MALNISGRIKSLYLIITLFALLAHSAGGQETWYSYKSGAWNDPDTWTTDPGGTTLAGTHTPEDDNSYVILTGRTVTLTENVSQTGLSVTINDGAILQSGTFAFEEELSLLAGQGILRLRTTLLPLVADNTFVATGGGTVEFNNTADFILPDTWDTYNNLTLNTSPNTVTATLLDDLTLNGNLAVTNGVFRINNDSETTRLWLTIKGNVTVAAGSSVTVGQGNVRTDASVTGISGGTAPFVDYYVNNTHTIEVHGNFTNNGTVEFTNQDHPVYNEFPINGAASVFFRGNSNSSLVCNGTTDFYNLILDKGTDQTYELSISSSQYQNFRLFGANISGGEGGGNNPILKKALWLRNGALRLFGKVVIPSLSEGTCDGGSNPNSDFYIPANAAMVIEGPDVIVLTTADSYLEVNAAYGVSIPNNAAAGINPSAGCSSFSILGRFQINNGYISTRESGGFIYWGTSAGEFIVNGGTIDAKQLRTAGSSGGLAAYRQTGGTLILRGRMTQNVSGVTTPEDLRTVPLSGSRSGGGLNAAVGSFNIDRDDNVFEMSGGTIEILDVPGISSAISRAFQVNSLPAYYNVTGGTVNIKPTTAGGTDFSYGIVSSAPIYNLNIDRVSGTQEVRLLNIPAKSGVTLRLNPPLKVLNNLSLSNDATLDARGYEVRIGGNFNLPSGTTYIPDENITTFNGSGSQTFTGGGTIVNNFYDLKIDKPTGSITLAGDPAEYTVSNTLNIARGTLNDGGKFLNVAGNIFVGGTHTSDGDGKIVLNGTTTQTIEASFFGTPELGNVELTNQSDPGAELISNLTAKSLTLNANAGGRSVFYIDKYRLTLNEGQVQSSGTLGFGITKMIMTDGTAGASGLKQGLVLNGSYSTNDQILESPVGVSGRYSPFYLLANINFTLTEPISGTFNVTPVNSAHPATSGGNILNYYWKIITSGFPGFNKSNVKSRAFYNSTIAAPVRTTQVLWGNSWINGQGSVGNTAAGQIDYNAPGMYEEADYTAGSTGSFVQPKILYSITSGPLNNRDTWSETSHSVADSPPQAPRAFDKLIIGGTASRSDSIWTTTGATVAEVTIRGPKTSDGSSPTLDISTTTGHTFNKVSGGGKFRIASNTGTSPSIPFADWEDFIQNDTAVFEYFGTGSYTIPATLPAYPNLHITSNAINVTKTLPDIDILVRQNLRLISGNTGSTMQLNNSASGRSLTIYGDVEFTNAGRLLVPATSGEKTINIYGDINFRYSDTDHINAITAAEGTGATHTLNFFGGNIISGNSRLNLYNGSGNNQMDLVLAGEGDITITNTTGATTNFTLNRLIIDKGTLSDNVYFQNNFTLGAPTNTAQKALELNAGTLHLENPSINIILSSGGAALQIPQTSALILNNGSAVNVTGNNTGIFLDGLLKADNSTINMGDGGNTNNRYIEYSGSGNAAIEMTGSSTLTVNSQIRRSLSQTNGILSYTQGGTSQARIYGRGVNQGRAKLEITNPGSYFGMSDDATLTIVRGGGTTFGDLYLRPASSSITGGAIYLGTNTVAGQAIRFDANIPLNDLYIVSPAGGNTAEIMVNPLELEGSLNISGNSTLVADGINVSLKGNLTNNGSYDYGTGNTTTFNGVAQNIDGDTETDFYNLTVSPTTSLTLNRDQVVHNNLVINSGTLIADEYDIEVRADVTNTATHSSTTGRLILNGTTGVQGIYGSGSYGLLEIDNANGARLYNNISLSRNLLLTNGILNINQFLLTLGENSEIVPPGSEPGNTFGPGRMIATDGVFSNIGIKKHFPDSYTGTFEYPLGVTGTTDKYTPAIIDIASTNAGSVRVNVINERHPAILEPWRVLNYYWEAESAISGFEGNLVFRYHQSDVMQDEEDEKLYVAARVIFGPGDSWSKAAPGPATDNVDEDNNEIFFDFPAGTDNLGGEYTAGHDDDIPDEIPIFYSKEGRGDWNDVNHWEPQAPAGGPSGFIVVIPANSIVETNGNRRFAYQTTINGRLEIGETYGHNLGSIEGTGTLALEDQILPAGRFTGFFTCNGGTLEFGGNKDYTIIADRINTLRNLHFLGTGTRTLPNKDLVICNELLIGNATEGPTVDNTSNRQLTIGGTMILNNGTFLAGTGAGATVRIKGLAPQSLSGFNQATSSPLYNIEIDNPDGLTLESQIDFNGNLILANGIITTTEANILHMLNPVGSAVVTPAGGSASSYVNGPMTRYVFGGNDFIFPTGKGTRYGRLGLLSPSTGNWTAEYFNTPYDPLTTDITLNSVSATEHWQIISPTNTSEAAVRLRWDGLSDINPLSTDNGIGDIRVAEFDGSEWTAKPSTATGTNSSGTVKTNANITIGHNQNPQYYTLGSVSVVTAMARFAITEDVCEGTTIPVTFSGVTPANLDYQITYTVSGATRTIDITSLPFPGIPTMGDPGDYKLTGFTYDPGATSGMVDDETEITVFPSPNLPSADDAARCGPGELTLEASGALGEEVYRWYTAPIGGTLLPDGGETFQTPYLNATTSYYVSIYGSGCEGPRAEVTATINPIPEYSLSGSDEQICEGESFTLTVNFMTVTEPFRLIIYENAVIIIDAENQWDTDPYTYTNPDMEWNGPEPGKVYSYTVSIEDANGCLSEPIPPQNVTVWKIPETGPQYHIPNTFGE